MMQKTADAITYARDWIADPGGDPHAQCPESIATSFAEALVEISRPHKVDTARIANGDWVRASHLMICEKALSGTTKCGVAYIDHPRVPGYEWLHRLCDGRLVKL